MSIDVLWPTGTERYSNAEGDELVRAAEHRRADVIHALDYRVPLRASGIPLVVTIHDVLRLVRPQLCYTDGEFTLRFGPEALAELHRLTDDLRALSDYPAGAQRALDELRPLPTAEVSAAVRYR
jgi:hypothetical protein